MGFPEMASEHSWQFICKPCLICKACPDIRTKLRLAKPMNEEPLSGRRESFSNDRLVGDIFATVSLLAVDAE